MYLPIIGTILFHFINDYMPLEIYRVDKSIMRGTYKCSLFRKQKYLTRDLNS